MWVSFQLRRKFVVGWIQDSRSRFYGAPGNPEPEKNINISAMKRKK